MTEEYYCGQCKKHMDISTFPHPHTSPVWPQFTELLEEESEPKEPAMYYCKYCGNYHPVAAKEFYCPLDPRR